MLHKHLLILALLVCGYVKADAVQPADLTTTTEQTFDLRTVPPVFKIWQSQSAGYDTSDYLRWSRNALVCLSSTDATYGACRTTPLSTLYTPTDDYYIPLTFKLENTNITVNLLVTALGYIGNGGTFPASHSWVNPPSPERFFTYEIPSTELRKLTYPGRWTATLKQIMYQWDPRAQVASWQSNITLNVTDLYRPILYFPAFPSGNAVVDLRLKNRPGTENNAVSSGNASLDMCLYDGGMSASHIALIFQDEGKSAPGRSSGQFSVYRDGGDASLAADRLDYEIKVLNPTTGNVDMVTNGTQINWSNTNARSIQRQVVLPGVPGVSLCVPMPITLLTPTFNLGDKSPGHYAGKLRVIYTPTTY